MTLKLHQVPTPQAEGVAQSLCNLLNLLVEPQQKEKVEEISDMELDANERAAEADHQKAQEMIDGPKSTWKTAAARRRRGKQSGSEQMDQTEPTAGKRPPNETEAGQPPAPKCLALPAVDPKKGETEYYNLEEADAAAALAANAAAEAAKVAEAAAAKGGVTPKKI